MKIGRLLGTGLTAEVYEWGQGKIIKLYFNRFSTDKWVNHEAKIGHIVNKSGIISPAVYDKIEINGRKGIIYERIYGKSIAEHLLTAPWELFYFMKKIADLHYDIHKFSAQGLPTQKERFEYTIKLSSRILGYRVKRILDYIDSLPDGNSICHGDLNFCNVIISGKNLVPIDWNGAYSGNPLSDVARTSMIICSPAITFGIHPALSFFAHYLRQMTYKTYINEYMRLSKAKFEDIDAWVLPVAAAKLKDRIPGEKKWLMDIIDDRLKRLN